MVTTRIEKLKMLFQLLTGREKKKLVVVFLAMLITGLLEVVGVGSIMPFISVASKPESIETNQYLNWAYNELGFSSSQQFIFMLGVVVIAFIFINNAARAGISYIIHHYTGMRRHKISVRLLEKYLQQPYVFFLNQNTSILSKNILSEVAVVVNRVLMVALNFIANTIIVLFLVLLLFLVNPVLSLTVVGVLGVAYFGIFGAVRNYLLRKGKERAKVNGLRYKYVYEALGGIKDVKLLGREKVFLKLYSSPSRSFSMNDAMTDVVAELPKFIMETIAFGGILILILVLMGAGGELNSVLPLVSLFALAGYRMLPALQKVFKAVAKIKYSFPIVEVIHRDLVGLPEGKLQEDVRSLDPLPFTDTLKLKDIKFTYPETEIPVIKQQSLQIKANTTIGFVGPTGCGKTTIVDIILGLLRTESGSIRIDGTELTDENIAHWQANLGYVPQTIFLTDDTIAKNIAFGIAEEDIDMEAIRKAAQIANLDQFIDGELDKGYQTVVGERGVRLSGGQRQRIGIARALYHNPAVLILDEATSALDSLTERAIMEAIDNLSHRKTIIMIAHRLTTVRKCDQIFILDKGVIIKQGTYDELIESSESFRRMAEGS